MHRTTRLPLLAALLLFGATQTGCATLVTATACVASNAKNCGPAIGAAATLDAVVLDATLSEPEPYEYAVCDENGWCRYPD